MRFSVTWVRAALVLLVVIGAAAGGEARAAKQAAIVMDMRNGAIFYEDNADRRQHPASLTKMMTLYLTFEAVRDGRIGLDEKFRVSRHASRQPASKLYLKQGQRVSVRHLIRATAIKSANDAAMVLAEGIGGSQAAFAEMMTRKARELGMRNTTFKNPHGLTAEGHLSTARDMAILARHLFYDFPEYYNIFSRKNDYAAGKRVWTTNRLLSSYRGADGIKTGYTRAAGYNLAASAHRGQERIIAVVMGASSSAGRNRKVAELLDLGFRKAPDAVRVVEPRSGGTVQVASAPLPAAKPGAPATGLEALAEVLVTTASAATPPTSGPVWRSAYAPRSADLPLPRAVVEAKVAAVVVPGVPMPLPRPGGAVVGWAAEIGPYVSETAALATLADIAARKIADASRFQVNQSGGRNGRPVYSLHLAGLSEGDAATLCGVVSASEMDCSVIHTTH
jgi:D-alanyl-D-alanine carboxypeptidase